MINTCFSWTQRREIQSRLVRVRVPVIRLVFIISTGNCRRRRPFLLLFVDGTSLGHLTKYLHQHPMYSRSNQHFDPHIPTHQHSFPAHHPFGLNCSSTSRSAIDSTLSEPSRVPKTARNMDWMSTTYTGAYCLGGGGDDSRLLARSSPRRGDAERRRE